MKRPVSKSEDKLRKQIEALERENSHLRSLLLTDELTGLYNKRFLHSVESRNVACTTHRAAVHTHDDGCRQFQTR